MKYLKFYIPLLGIYFAWEDMVLKEKSILINTVHYHLTCIFQTFSIVGLIIFILNEIN